MYERNPDFDTDLIAAAAPTTSEQELEALLDKHYGEVEILRAVAHNPACSLKLLAMLWKHVESIAAGSPALVEHTANPRWEQLTRQKPARRTWEGSRSIDERRPAIYKLLYVMEHGDGAYQRKVMAFDSIPEKLIREHAKSKSAPLRKVIASRKTAPDEVFEQLARDSARTVRQTLAANLHAPKRVIAMLANDKVPAVAEAARNNPACPDEVVHQARLADAAKPALSDAAIDSLKFPQLAALAYDTSTPADKLPALAAHADPRVRFIAGINPTTPTGTLAELCKDQDTWVRAGAALNPNTPVECLTDLLRSADTDVQVGLASNPSLPEADQLQLADTADDRAALTLANLTAYPSVWDRLAAEVVPVKAARDKTWRHYLAEILKATRAGKFSGLQLGPRSRYLFVHRIAARAEQCPPELAAHYAHYLFDDYSQNPTTLLALLEGKTPVRPQAYPEWKLKKWLSEGDAPGHVANFFVRSDHEKRRAQTINSWTTQIVYLLPFVMDGNTNTRKRLAKRKDLIRFMFEMLARDDKPGVREEIAKNKRCPKNLLTLMSADKATTVRAAAAKRAPKSTASPAALKTLANQGSATERARLARDTSKAEVLTDLSKDRAASVRVTVAENRETPPEVLDSMAQDKDPKVRRVAARRSRNPDLVKKLLLEDSEPEVRIAAAGSMCWKNGHDQKASVPLYKPEFISWILDASDGDVRAIVAWASEDERLHLKYMADPDPVVTQALARNRHLSEAIKLKLARKTDDQLTLSLLADKTDNEALFLTVAHKAKSQRAEDVIRCNQTMLARPSVQNQLCKHPLSYIRNALAKQGTLTELALTVLANDESDWIRKIISRRKAG